LAVKIEAVETLAVEMGQPSGEGLARLGAELNLDRPVFARLEGFDFGFPLAHEPQRNGLTPPRGAATWAFAPQHRRQCKTDQVIERPPGEVGFDQFVIDLAR